MAEMAQGPRAGLSPSVSPCTGSSRNSASPAAATAAAALRAAGGAAPPALRGGREKAARREKQEKKQQRGEKGKKEKKNKEAKGDGKLLGRLTAAAAVAVAAAGPGAGAAAAPQNGFGSVGFVVDGEGFGAGNARRDDDGEEEGEENHTAAQQDAMKDRMRAALQALRQRRADLLAAQAELETARTENSGLREQLAKASRAPSSVVLQSQLSIVRVDLEAAHRACEVFKAELKQAELEKKVLTESSQAAEQKLSSMTSELAKAKLEVEDLRRRLSAGSEELAVARKAKEVSAEEAAELRRRLSAAREEAERGQKEKASAVAGAETLRAQLGAARAELDKAQAQVSEHRKDVEELRSQLSDTRVELEEAHRSGTSAFENAQALAAQLGRARAELSFARGDGGGGAAAPPQVSEPARAELAAAWASIGAGLEQMRQAIMATGLLLPAGRPPLIVAVDGEAPGKARATSPVRAGVKSSRKAVDNGGKRKRGVEVVDEKSEKKRKKEKKSGKEKKEAREVNTSSHESGDEQESREKGRSAAAGAAFRKRQGLSSLPHRAHLQPGPPVLRLRHSEQLRGKAASGAALASPPSQQRLRFAPEERLVCQAQVTSYRDCSEDLWFTNPQANVYCERCQRRVPQKQGQLKGRPGSSSFMCDAFLCNECVADC